MRSPKSLRSGEVRGGCPVERTKSGRQKCWLEFPVRKAYLLTNDNVRKGWNRVESAEESIGA